MSIVSATNVHKTYASGDLAVRALRGVDIEVKQGEIVAIMGPSGCGKTTLLNCLSGLDNVNDGNISIGGKAIHELTDDEISEFRAKFMGFVFQTYNLLPVLTAQENVELPLLVSGVSTKFAAKKAQEQLELVGLLDRAHHRPAELSGGQQQRVAVARSLVNTPEIIWADEPTGNLDSQNEQEIMDLICDMNKQHKQTFVLVTHSETVGARTNRIIRMSDGLIASDS